MGKTTQASVQSVQTRPGGDYVLEPVAAGSLEIQFEDAASFEPSGGQVMVNGTVLDYVSVDLDSDVMTLAGPLPMDLGVTDFVAVDPPVESVVAVTVGDLGEVTVEVPHDLKAMLPEGERDAESGEVVLLEEVGVGAYRIVDVVGSAPAIIAGDPVGERVQITRDGLRVFVESANPMGEPYELVSLTNGRVSVGVMAEDGTLVGGISREGVLSGQTGAVVGDLSVKGLPVVGRLGGGVDAGWLDQLPRGIVAYNGRSKDLSASTEVERRYLNVTATLYPGRRYRVAATIRAVQGGSNGAVYVRIKHAPGSSRPLMTDPYLGPTELASATGTSSVNMRVTPTYEGFITVNAEEVHSFVSTFAGYYGAAPTAQSGHIYVEDVGPAVAESGGIDDAPGESTNRYATSWVATAANRYDKTGALISTNGSIDQWYWHGDPTDFQAAAMLFGGGATDSTDPGEVGATIPDVLTGATVEKVEVTVRNKVFYNGQQGVVGFGNLGATSLPPTLLVESTEAKATTSGALITRELPTSFFQGGTNAGVTFGDKDGIVPTWPLPLDSGAFHGVHDADPPVLTITYTR